MGCISRSSEQKTDSPTWMDPLGPTYRRNAAGKVVGKTFNAPTGAPEIRSDIFDYLTSNMGSQRQTAAEGGQQALRYARHPGFGAAQNLATRTIQGQYLRPSPYLTGAISRGRETLATGLDATRRRAFSQAESDAAARRAAFARSGLRYSTASQQGDQATQAAIAARVAEGEQMASKAYESDAARLIAENYARERGAQMAAPGMLAQSTQVPLQYYGVSNELRQQPEQAAGNLISGLSTGQVATPQSTYIQQPSVLDYVQGLAGVAASGMGSSW